MKMIFYYSTPDGALFGLPLEFDGHRGFNMVCAEAHSIACEASPDGAVFQTARHLQVASAFVGFTVPELIDRLSCVDGIWRN